jgi:hypothetical protein
VVLGEVLVGELVRKREAYDGSLGLPANIREHLLHELGWTGQQEAPL